MNQTQPAHMPSHFSRYKKLVVNDVIPTETMRLHTRLFPWTRRKHIAVKDENSSQLNAYLINPAYLDQTIAIPELTPVLSPSKLQVIQYSRISRNIPSSRTASILEIALIRSRRVAHLTKNRVTAFVGTIITRVKSAFAGNTTYTLQRGAQSSWGRRLAPFATALVLVGAGSVPFITSDQSVPQTTGQDMTQAPQQGGSIPDQRNQSIPRSNVIPLFNNSTREPIQFSSERTVPNTSVRALSPPQVATPVHSEPLIVQTDTPIVSKQAGSTPTYLEQTVPEPIAEPEALQPLEDTTEPTPLAEDETYTITETFTDTTTTLNGVSESLGL